jgi:uridine monophosphate synthetase
MATFFSRLESRVRQVDSLLCVGLDPHPDDLPEFSADATKGFCLRLIDATVDLVAAYKPNIAFFEALGPEGIAALIEVIAAIPDAIPVILDAKRGDIASTAQAYTQAAFETLGADAVTINPYLGKDAVDPFLLDPEKGVFLLCKTSNPGAEDLQDLPLAPIPSPTGRGEQEVRGWLLYEHVAQLAETWNTNDNLGLVVGATQIDSLRRVRAAAPDLWFLAPGVGAQGGDLRAALRAGLRADGLGMLIPVSRGISRAENPRQAAMELRGAINRERLEVPSDLLKAGSGQPSTVGYHSIAMSRLADGLLEAGCIKFGSFTLKSGIVSPIYIDLRRLVGYPRLLAEVAAAYIRILRDLEFDHLAALPYAALPIASVISLQGGWSMVYPRKEVKSYGTRAQIEGVYQPGEKAVVIDDLISTGGSKFEGIEKLESAGLKAEDVVVLIDRSPDRGAELVERGYKLHAVLTIADLLDHYEQTDQVDPAKIAEARVFLR